MKTHNLTRVELQGATASFRLPLFSLYEQPTLPIPPITTALGIVSAAVGNRVTLHDTEVGITFTSEERFRNMSRYLESGGGGHPPKWNRLYRHHLSNAVLTLYLPNALGKAFYRPQYPLSLGTSPELAKVTAIEAIELQWHDDVTYRDTLIPVSGNEAWLGGAIRHALPAFQLDDKARTWCNVQPYAFITHHPVAPPHGGWMDAEREAGVYLHKQLEGEYPTTHRPIVIDKDYVIPTVTGVQELMF